MGPTDLEKDKSMSNSGYKPGLANYLGDIRKK